jgi:hypothetical protein
MFYEVTSFAAITVLQWIVTVSSTRRAYLQQLPRNAAAVATTLHRKHSVGDGCDPGTKGRRHD